jgi:Uma2 family endonuclease
MAPAVLDPPRLLTAEEFAAMPEVGRFTELVKGVVIQSDSGGDTRQAMRREREIRSEIASALRSLVTLHQLGVVTERDPDTVRGADVAYFSYERLPKGPLPEGYPEVAPELVFEVLSPGDRWKKISAKIDEYLAAGVKLVYVVDPARRSAMLCEPGGSLRMFGDEEDLVFPGVLAELRFTLQAVLD